MGAISMYPIALNVAQLPLLLVGHGPQADKRLAMLNEYGAAQLTHVQTPTDEQISAAAIVMIVGLPRDEAEQLAQRAKHAGKLVNVEDVNDLCDFYFTANVKRGDLIFAVSTSGASPTLARKVKDSIAKIFGPEWAQRTEASRKKRAEFKAQGLTMREMMDASEQYLNEKGWLTFCKPSCRFGTNDRQEKAHE